MKSIKKLCCRKLHNFDAITLYRLIKDKEIVKYTNFDLLKTKKDAFDFVEKSKKEFRQKTAFHFLIELVEEKQGVGLISLKNVNFNNHSAEVSYWLGKNYQGQGLMKIALEQILAYGFEKLKLKRIYDRVMHPNIASSKVLEKSGFQYEGRLRMTTFRNNQWYDNLRYSLLNKEYKKLIKYK